MTAERSPRHWLWAALAGVVIMSLARVLADNSDLTSAGTFGVAIRTAAPIALAGLAGLYAERSGTVNIGLEGMMIMGTVFAGWWGWQMGPWMALVGGIVGGIIGGLLHALATVTFGVNQIVSGFAINLIAPGVARFMANQLFAGQPGGSVTNSPGNSSSLGRFTVPFVSGGDLFGWTTPNVLGWFEGRGWFVIADVAGLGRGLTSNLSYDVLLVGVVFVASAVVLWRTPFGLRLRAAGERPSAADSLGVSVIRMRYYGMIISGGLNIQPMEIESVVEDGGHRVAGVATAADEAVRLAEVHRPALVLMDIRLRGPRDGIDAATEIRRSFGIRSLFVSAHTDPVTLKRAQLADPLGWLPKPFSGHQLAAALEAALRLLRPKDN
jgi:ABC-type uncharacterized transport system permease subunit/CheY-like chemotaxis protein